MTDTKIISAVVDPVEHPEQAANQVLLAIINNDGVRPPAASKIDLRAKDLISIHKELTDYFQTLKK